MKSIGEIVRRLSFTDCQELELWAAVLDQAWHDLEFGMNRLNRIDGLPEQNYQQKCIRRFLVKRIRRDLAFRKNQGWEPITTALGIDKAAFQEIIGSEIARIGGKVSEIHFA